MSKGVAAGGNVAGGSVSRTGQVGDEGEGGGGSERGSGRTTDRPGLESAEKEAEWGSSSSDESDDDSSDDEELDARAGIDTSLPPIVDLDAILADLVQSANERDRLVDVVNHLNGRALRVVTVCSGSESPILVLRKISEQLFKLTGRKLEIEHVFACDNNKSIQKYIMRNFNVTVFVDVADLCNEFALTAKGLMVRVPRDIDLLIAGPSCKDFSGLNANRKSLDGNGESGTTFRGTLRYINKARPRLVIIENIVACPWDQVIKRLKSINFLATRIIVDTVEHYLPQSRRRGYLPAIPNNFCADYIFKAWTSEMERLARPASVPFWSFLEPRQDSAALADRSGPSRTGRESSEVEVVGKWTTESRRTRREEELGKKMVLTLGTDGRPTSTFLDSEQNRLLVVLSERARDTISVQVLREVKKGVDPLHKDRMLDAKQGPSWGAGSPRFGLAPCLVTSMMALATNGATQLGWADKFRLQGLPLDELDLTDLSDTERHSLAGNAMSTTVVGTAMIAALLCTYPALPRGSGTIASAPPSTSNSAPPDDEPSLERFDQDVKSAPHARATAEVLDLASRSRRMCELCERGLGIAPSQILRCTVCGLTICEKCEFTCLHTFQHERTQREDPNKAYAQLVKHLPARMTSFGFDQSSLERLASRVADVDSELLDEFIETVSTAAGDEDFKFDRLERRTSWVATYLAPNSRLEVHFEASQVEWRLYVNSPADLAVEDPLRVAFESPVARMVVRDLDQAKSLVHGRWKVSFPLDQDSTTLKFKYVGKDVPSWRARYRVEDFVDEEWNDRIEVNAPPATAAALERDVSGVYQLFQNCGTSQLSLYKRVTVTGQPVGPSERPMFFFHDPVPHGPPGRDPFVFADNCLRLERRPGDTPDLWQKRLPVCTVELGFDLIEKNGEEAVRVDVPSKGVRLKGAGLEAGKVRVSDLIKAGKLKAPKFESVVDQARAGTRPAMKGPKKHKRRRVEASFASDLKDSSSTLRSADTLEADDDDGELTDYDAVPINEPHRAKHRTIKPAAPTAAPAPTRKSTNTVASRTAKQAALDSDSDDWTGRPSVRPAKKAKYGKAATSASTLSSKQRGKRPAPLLDRDTSSAAFDTDSDSSTDPLGLSAPPTKKAKVAGTRPAPIARAGKAENKRKRPAWRPGASSSTAASSSSAAGPAAPAASGASKKRKAGEEVMAARKTGKQTKPDAQVATKLAANPSKPSEKGRGKSGGVRVGDWRPHAVGTTAGPRMKKKDRELDVLTIEDSGSE